MFEECQLVSDGTHVGTLLVQNYFAFQKISCSRTTMNASFSTCVFNRLSEIKVVHLPDLDETGVFYYHGDLELTNQVATSTLLTCVPARLLCILLYSFVIAVYLNGI